MWRGADTYGKAEQIEEKRTTTHAHLEERVVRHVDSAIHEVDGEARYAVLYVTPEGTAVERAEIPLGY